MKVQFNCGYVEETWPRFALFGQSARARATMVALIDHACPHRRGCISFTSPRELVVCQIATTILYPTQLHTHTHTYYIRVVTKWKDVIARWVPTLALAARAGASPDRSPSLTPATRVDLSYIAITACRFSNGFRDEHRADEISTQPHTRDKIIRILYMYVSRS